MYVNWKDIADGQLFPLEKALNIHESAFASSTTISEFSKYYFLTVSFKLGAKKLGHPPPASHSWLVEFRQVGK